MDNSRSLLSHFCSVRRLLAMGLMPGLLFCVEAGAAGPDAFGYVSTDSLSGGPAFSFTDISATGTRLTFFDADALPTQNQNADDGVALDVSLADLNGGLGFPFYGTLRTSVNMGTNGFLHFQLNGTSDSLSNNCPIQNAAEPNDIIAVLWDDLVLRNPPSTIAGGFVQVFSPCPYSEGGTGDCVVFQWDNCDHFGGGIDSFDFQAVLYDSGNILMLYPEGSGGTPTNPPFNPEHGSGSTTGLENADASDSLTHVCDTNNSLPPNFAVLFTYPGPRVALDKTVDLCTADPAGPGADLTCVDICKTNESLIVLPGTDVKYCYKVANTGTTNISGLLLVDDQLGTINDPAIPAFLAPAAGFEVFRKETITADVTNTVTLTYTSIVGRVVTLTDTVTILIDTDGDGVADRDDNCDEVANPDQADADGDGFGDACEGCPSDPAKQVPGICGCGVSDAADSDGDGVPDCLDNCVDTPNTDQADTNADGVGDACEAPPAGQPGCGGCGVAGIPLAPLTLLGMFSLRRRSRGTRR